MALTRVVVPPLQPGLPIVWDPMVVVFALAQQLRRCGLATAHPPRGLLDELVSPWGCRRVGATRVFTVPCDCGRTTRRLILTGRGWNCSQCDRVGLTRLEMQAARLLFALRLGLRGRLPRALHARTVRLLVGRLPADLGARRFAVVQAATVVVSYDPTTGEKPWRPLGPVGQALGAELLQVWLDEVANPVAYRARCEAESQSVVTPLTR